MYPLIPEADVRACVAMAMASLEENKTALAWGILNYILKNFPKMPVSTELAPPEVALPDIWSKNQRLQHMVEQRDNRFSSIR